MMNKAIAGAYLRGLFDGEGSVSNHNNGRIRSIRIANTDTSIITSAKECLQTIGIEAAYYWSDTAKMKHPGSKPICNIAILSRRNIVLFCRYVGSNSAEKSIKLKALRTSFAPHGRYRKYRYHRSQSPLFINRVARLYQSGLTQREVSARLACSPETVLAVLKVAGVPTRKYSPQELGRMGQAKKQSLALTRSLSSKMS